MPSILPNTPSALPPITPHAIRDELTKMIVNDLLGPAGGADEELVQREDRVTGRYLVGMLAPKSPPIEAEELDNLGTDGKDDPEVGKTDASTPSASTFFPNSIGMSFVVQKFGHGFHESKQGVRYTNIESARRTVLDRELALNHRRCADEVKAGLHQKGRKGRQKNAGSATKGGTPYSTANRSL
jgi:hypothetical protein